jgi:hypothetical protein
LKNEKAKEKSFCFLREIEFDEENQGFKELMQKEGFYNKENAENIELQNLKTKVEQTIPESIFKYKVITNYK